MIRIFFSNILNGKQRFMGAIKENNYNEKELEIAYLCDAIAHPARKRIVDLLYKYQFCRNIDLADSLNLSPTAIMNHLTKLKRADLIHIQYGMHHYKVILNSKKIKVLINYLNSISD